MAIKNCFKCGEGKPFHEFYRHKAMADGRVNKCKECNKADVRANRKLKVEYYREYDAKRGSRQSPEYLRDWRGKYPNKYKAQTSVSNAVRDGRLIKFPCESCGREDNIHGHHDDYLKPLEVRWLCPVHHKEWHDEHGEAKNGT